MKILIGFAVIAALLYSGVVALVWARQDNFLFFPDDSRFDLCEGSELAPLTPQTADFDGGRAHYHLHKGPEAIGTIVVFHGNAGSACDRAFYAEMFRDQPYDVMLAEYPGYAGLGGRPSQAGILAVAVEIAKIARRTAPNGPVILLGESIGSGVATYAAARVRVDGLILISPYTSIRELASLHFPWLPAGWILKNPFPADEWAKDVQAPVLVLHGRNDETIPFEMGRRQSAAFPDLRAFVELPEAGHNDWLDAGGTLSVGALHTFVESFLPRDP